ncbi:acylphosphatase [Salinicoccus roseus]|uniref:acylphosphatase n=1 Tax=Salinicoccus roseus TaxID=45670 RepID=UPI00230195C3|nr:acylphosphatase [Salinicoccus roseus]
MERENIELKSDLTEEVVEGIKGFKLCAYLVALEGWRRGLKLTWYKDETDLCKMHRVGGSTQGKFFSLSSEDKSHYFLRSRGDGVTNKAVNLCGNKESTLKLLKEQGVPTPEGSIFNIDDERMFEYAENIGFPVIIKPLNGSMGRGVYTNINSIEELQEALTDFIRRYKKYKSIILEKHHHGQEYRIYVVDEEVIAVTNRIPANITGDGVQSVRKLIEEKNEARKDNPYLASKPIKVDYEVKLALKNNGLEMDSILPEGKVLYLREKSNLSSGGDSIEANDKISEEVKQIAIDSLKVVPSLPHAGVDIIVDSEDDRKGVVLEINATAEISFHLFPWEGKARDVPGAIIDYYFPETREKEKSLAYFDYHSVIEPLKTWASDEVVVAPAPIQEMHRKCFTVNGKVQKVGYMNYIRRQALKRNIHGTIRKNGLKQVEIDGMTTDEKIFDEFIDVCYKGSKKSRVDHVKIEDKGMENMPYKMGFVVETE